MDNSLTYIEPPQLITKTKSVDSMDMKMTQIIKSYNPGVSFDVGLIGAPLSRSSISVSGASETPNAIRSVWKNFTTYNIDYDINIEDVNIADIGDIRMHVTNITECHDNIENGIYEVLKSNESFLPVIMGGDHSITCPSFKAFKKYHYDKKIGIIQFDTHFDLRNLEDGGPSNGTPIRGLLESGQLEGQHVVNIGLHGYFNSYAYKEYADEQQIKFYTMREVRMKGIEKTVKEALAYLSDKVDLIYLTVDVDVLDISSAPGVPASTPGGMQTWELLEAIYLIGQEHNVCAMDIVELDPNRDFSNNITAKTGAYAILNFLCGFKKR
ncbi:formimidoylglutamase [Bacillus sp. M6-12]|uniref:formimidoylglutamase n=1 Tax=Bacillus sp. M6-12 TaxID=2054166 RepID=UPI000C76FDFE|nr:formimidoylglutamase [Bacillus sp. M6-12]PLS14781.1 formimidoylglutamase [Bacillus sp. M6-12]